MSSMRQVAVKQRRPQSIRHRDTSGRQRLGEFYPRKLGVALTDGDAVRDGWILNLVRLTRRTAASWDSDGWLAGQRIRPRTPLKAGELLSSAAINASYFLWVGWPVSRLVPLVLYGG